MVSLMIIMLLGWKNKGIRWINDRSHCVAWFMGCAMINGDFIELDGNCWEINVYVVQETHTGRRNSWRKALWLCLFHLLISLIITHNISQCSHLFRGTYRLYTHLQCKGNYETFQVFITELLEQLCPPKFLSSRFKILTTTYPAVPPPFLFN